MNFPYNEKVKVTSVQYRIEVFHEGFVFLVYIGEYSRNPMIENIRILDCKDEWRNLKYSVKHHITNQVEQIAHEWMMVNL